MLTPEAAREICLAVNLNVLLTKQIREMSMVMLEVSLPLLDAETPEDKEKAEKLSRVCEGLVRSKELIGVVMQRYEPLLDEYRLMFPEDQQRIVKELEESDVGRAIELQIAMSAKDRLVQILLQQGRPND